MDEYPGCEFVVENYPKINTLIPVYDHTALYDNVYAVLQREAIASFAETIESTYGAETLEYWKGVKKGDSWAPIIIEINDISQFDIIGEMVAGYQTHFKETYPGFEPAYFTVRMKLRNPVTRLVDNISDPHYYHAGFLGGTEGIEWNWEDYSYTNDARIKQR